MNVHPIITPASPSLASPIFDASFDSIESLTTTFASPVVPTLETTTVTEVALGYHRNGQYSITAMTTHTDAVTERYAYTAYGQRTILSANGTVLTTSAVGNRYTYTGREWDENFKLIETGAGVGTVDNSNSWPYLFGNQIEDDVTPVDWGLILQGQQLSHECWFNMYLKVRPSNGGKTCQYHGHKSI